MKKEFVEPAVELVRLDVVDVITISYALEEDETEVIFTK